MYFTQPIQQRDNYSFVGAFGFVAASAAELALRVTGPPAVPPAAAAPVAPGFLLSRSDWKKF